MFKGIWNKIIWVMVGMLCVLVNSTCYAAKYETSTISDTFPESYQSYIDRLKEAHPNWNIKAFYTHLDWNKVLNSEASGSYSRVQNTAYGDAWKRLESSEDSSYNAAGFVLASRAAVAYTLDPRNFLTDEGIFQFRVINQNVESDTETAVKEIAHSTPMYTDEYASIIKKVGTDKTIAPTFIISRIRQETACDIINNGSINGKSATYPGYYNFFNIGARDGNGAVLAGLSLAYANGWNTHESAIAGGMDWLYNHYIQYGQSTVYFQKFDVANHLGNATTLLSMQYMSNISAPMGEAKITYNGLKRAEALDNTYTFYIPIYENMPQLASPLPSIGYYENDNTMIYLDDPDTEHSYDTFKIRSTADSSSSSNIVYTINQSSDISEKTVMKRIKKGVDTGWDYIEFEVDGKKIEGYVWNYYVFEYEYTKVTSVALNQSNKTVKLGDEFKLLATITPDEAKFKEVSWSSSNDNVATVDDEGNVKAVSVGSAIITVTTDDQSKTATCIVNVTDREPSISLDSENYTVLKGKYGIFNVNIENTDISDYEAKIEDENIAKIENGRILGISSGTTKMIVTIKGTDISKEVNVNVIELSENDINVDSSLKVENDIISKVEPETTVKDLCDKISTTYALEVKRANGDVLGENDIVGTGTTINFKDTNGNVICTYTIVIYGDINGDGYILANDYVLIKKHIMDDGGLSGIKSTAADVNKDGDILANDYVLIKNHIMNDGGYVVQ